MGCLATVLLNDQGATGLAASRISADQLAQVRGHLEVMRQARDDVELLNRHDAAFHRAVIAATGNATLSSLLEGISSRTLRPRIWRGLVDGNASDRTVAEHEPFTPRSPRVIRRWRRPRLSCT